MKKLNLLLFVVLLGLFGLVSCEEEDFENCPDITVDIDSVSNGSIYRFIALADGIKDLELVWTVNDSIVDSGNINDVTNQILEFEFEPGAYKVCVKVANENCPLQVCKEIIVEEPDDKCPELFFEAEQEGNSSNYLFEADFEAIDSTSYWWSVNGEIVHREIVDSGEKDDRFYYQFEPGSYEVCILTETPDCPEGTSFCKVIEVEQTNACPELFFEAEQDGNNPAYYFFPSTFENPHQVSLVWNINGEYVGTTTSNDDPFYYQFEPGRYEVCLFVETPECPNGTSYCKVIEIESTGCPELSFNEEQDGDSLNYFFFPDAFEGIDQTQIDWFVAGTFVGSSPSNAHNNPFTYQFEKAGIYNICMKIETPGCPEGTEFCKTITVGEVCPGVPVFDYYPSGNNNYTFTVRQVEWSIVSEFRWYLNEDLIVTPNGNPYSDNLIEIELSPGTYEICSVALADNCPEDVRYCQTIVIEDNN